MAINQHYYIQDRKTGIIARTVGYTYEDELLVYPKYVPSLHGNRSNNSIIKYKGITYPTGSISYLAKYNLPESSDISLKYNDRFNVFIPSISKEKAVLYDPYTMLNNKLSRMGNELEHKLGELLDIMTKRSGLDIKHFGLDASMLCGMETPLSDIDLVVYGFENAAILRETYQSLLKEKFAGFATNDDVSQFTIARRKDYSPLMTPEEIVLWESTKFGGHYKGTKFSFMPVNPLGKYSHSYTPTSTITAMEIELTEAVIIGDPGIVDLSKHKVKVIYGPKSIDISEYVTFLPSRMGIFLKPRHRLFILGQLYKIVDSNSFAITQFPWDDKTYIGESIYVTKIELCDLTSMIPALLGLEYNKNHDI